MLFRDTMRNLAGSMAPAPVLYSTGKEALILKPEEPVFPDLHYYYRFDLERLAKAMYDTSMLYQLLK